MFQERRKFVRLGLKIGVWGGFKVTCALHDFSLKLNENKPQDLIVLSSVNHKLLDRHFLNRKVLILKQAKPQDLFCN